MAGRPGKPTDLILMEGKSHRTKAEIKQRQEVEQALYTGQTFKESMQVKDNEVAHKEFLRLKKLYKNIAFVDALDQQMINRYCLEVANLQRLQEILEETNELLFDSEDIKTKIALIEQVNRIAATMQKSKELLLKYEDRLFLSPAGRIKSIPKSPKPKEKPSGIAAIMAKRSEK
jgi:phage terminase small subunit